LLYETGDLAEATRLMDESYLLGSDGGAVDYLAARYVIGARIKAAHGDHGSAADRLAAGAKAAVRLRLPRLAARINNERIRLGIELPQEVAAGLRSSRTIPRDNGIATMTAELDEDSAVRLLSASDSADDHEQACRRAADLAAAIDGKRRPLAALQAQVLRIETLATAGRAADARDELGPVAAKCAELGLSRLLVDAGLA
jgi:serine/threonine-protein kinase PknK